MNYSRCIDKDLLALPECIQYGLGYQIISIYVIAEGTNHGLW